MMWTPSHPKYQQFLAEYGPVSDAFIAGTLREPELHQWYERRLRVVLRHVKEKSDFYRRHLANVDADSVTLANLPQLPFTTKGNLRQEMMAVLSGSISDAIFFYETTGTTGRATPCPRDGKEIWASNAQLTANWADVFRQAFGDRRPVVGIIGPTELHSLGDTLGDVCRNLELCSAKIWPHSPVVGFAKTLQIISQLNVEVLCASPGLLLAIAKEAHKAGIDPRSLGVKLLMTLGEICTGPMSRNLEEVWGAKLYDALYGAQEAFVFASASPDNRLTPAMPNYVFEVVDPETGAWRGHTGEGEMVVTMLVDGIKPLIRYKTGDLVRLAHDAGRAGRHAWTLDVLGRVKDTFPLHKKSCTPKDVEIAAMEGVTGCLGYQIILDRVEGEDHVTIRLDMRDGADPRVAGRVSERFAARFDVKVRTEVVEDLPVLVNAGGFISWKAARIVDRRVGKAMQQMQGAFNATVTSHVDSRRPSAGETA